MTISIKHPRVKVLAGVTVGLCSGVFALAPSASASISEQTYYTVSAYNQVGCNGAVYCTTPTPGDGPVNTDVSVNASQSFANLTTGGQTSFTVMANTYTAGYDLGASVSLGVTNYAPVTSEFYAIAGADLRQSITASASTVVTLTFALNGSSQASGVNYADWNVLASLIGFGNNSGQVGELGGTFIPTGPGLYSITYNQPAGTGDLDIQLQARVCVADCGAPNPVPGSNAYGDADYLDTLTLVNVATSNGATIVDATTGAPLPTFGTTAMPEPSSVLLYGSALAAVPLIRRRTRRGT